MTADVSSAAAGDTTDPQALATIPEDSKYDNTANAKEMDTKDEETTENLNITKSQSILVTTANKPHKDNSSFGITSTTTKSEVASSPTKFAKMTLRRISRRFLGWHCLQSKNQCSCSGLPSLLCCNPDDFPKSSKYKVGPNVVISQGYLP